jgi:ATP-dependent DNA helicase RecQ
MRLRTARRGPNAGNQFWGCSRYPACKATVEFTATPSDGDPRIQTASAPAAPPLAFPVHVAAAPRERQGQSAFFQACGLPAPFVEHLHTAGADRSLVRAAAQWRLDFPLPHAEGVPPEDRNVIAVAESLLARGATPLCSPALERTLGPAAVPPDEPERVIEAMRRVVLAPTCRFRPLRFDSPEERAVFEWVLALVDREGLPWSLVPQIELASITSAIDPLAAERGDLLLVHAERDPVVVEVDGSEHDAHIDRDEERDRALEAAGVRVVRVRASEARDGRGPNLDMLKQILLDGRRDLPPETELSRIVRWCKYFHQLQLSLLTALRGGWLRLGAPWCIGVALPTRLRGDPQAATIIRLAVADLLELIGRLARLHGRPVPALEPRVAIVGDADVDDELDVLVGPADGGIDNFTLMVRARFLVSDLCFPTEIQAPITAASPARLVSPEREDARWFLHYLFRKDDFWEGQWESIQRTLRGFDSVVLLPTGAGKSIAFQLAALLLPGRCVVVDPIISLIDDQIDNLAAVGIDRCIGITSQLTTEERELALQAFKSGHYLFCYVAPERLQTVPFREALRALTTNTPISLIAIDEAHCVSEWGHDFRTAYLNLGRITRDYCASRGVVPPLVALTGTASKIVLKDVQRELAITAFDAIISPKTFDRPELRYTILTSPSGEKVQRVLGFLERLPTDFGVARSHIFRPMGRQTYAGLVFCPHVNGPYGVVQQAEYLSRALRTPVGVYSGEPPRNTDPDGWEDEKRKVARDFKRDRTAVLACTKAFGMGIDKPNIRYTIHIGLPASIESFYQEAGRAGRDRRRAECAIVLSNDDPRRSQHILSPATPLDEVGRVVNETSWDDADDIVRALWFHVRAFRGELAEVEDIASMLDQLGDVQTRRQINVTWRDPRWSSEGRRRDAARERAEKALHRLVVLGVVEDYTVNFASQKFGVRIAGATQEEIAAAFGRYAGAYQQRLGEQAEREALALRREPNREYVLVVAERLVSFIYQHIELARRRALNEMLQAAISGHSGDDLRRRILDYLEQSEWDERLEAVRASAVGGVDSLAPVLDDLVSPNDAAALRAATGRALASYPDVPGLLILRSVSEALSPDADPEVVRQNVEAALGFAAENFRLDSTEVAAALGQAIARARDKAGAGELLMQSSLGSTHADRVFVRALIQHVPRDLAAIPARWLMNELAARCAALVTAEGG